MSYGPISKQNIKIVNHKPDKQIYRLDTRPGDETSETITATHIKLHSQDYRQWIFSFL